MYYFFAGVKFVTKVISDTCGKYFCAEVNLSRVNACKICEICRIQDKVFTKQLELVCGLVDGCTKQFVQNR